MKPAPLNRFAVFYWRTYWINALALVLFSFIVLAQAVTLPALPQALLIAALVMLMAEIQLKALSTRCPDCGEMVGRGLFDSFPLGDKVDGLSAQMRPTLIPECPYCECDLRAAAREATVRKAG